MGFVRLPSIIDLSRLNQVDLFELLEPDRQPVAIRTILIPPWHPDHLPSNPFQPEFDKRTIVDFEQPVRDVNSVIGFDPDQMSIKGRMVDLGQRQAIRYDRLPKLLVHPRRCEPGLGQMGDRTAASVGAQDGISERCLVNLALISRRA